MGFCKKKTNAYVAGRVRESKLARRQGGAVLGTTRGLMIGGGLEGAVDSSTHHTAGAGGILLQQNLGSGSPGESAEIGSPKRRKLFKGGDGVQLSAPSPLSQRRSSPPKPQPHYLSHSLAQHPNHWRLAAEKTEGLFDEIKRLTQQKPARAAITENGSGNSVKLMVEGMWNLASPEKQLYELEKRAQGQQQQQQQSQAALPFFIMG